MDYAKGVVTLAKPCLTAQDAGRWVTVRSATHEATVRIEKALAPDKFPCAGQDLRAGRWTIPSAEGNTIKTNGVLYFVESGMTVVNEQGRVLTRVTSTKELSLVVERPITAADLPDADRDGVGRFILMALGPGDEARVGSVVAK